MKESISNNIKTIGFIMTCFMVFYHMGDLTWETSNLFDNYFNYSLNQLFNLMGFIVMSHFFSVTGFLLMYGFTLGNFKNKIKRRFFSLLVPYVVWQTIFSLPCFINGSLSIKGYIAQNYMLVAFPIDGALWYVYAIFLLVFLSPIFYILMPNKKIGFILITCLIICSQLIKQAQFEPISTIVNYGVIPNILGYMPAYCVGMYLGKFYKSFENDNFMKYVIVLLYISVFVNIFISDYFYKVAVEILPILIVYHFPSIKGLENRAIYNITFIVYAIHQPVLSYCFEYFKLIYSHFLPISINNLLVRLLMLVFILFLSTTIYTVVNKLSPKFAYVLTGGR